MQPVTQSVTGVGKSPWVMPNYHLTPFNMQFNCMVSGTVTFEIDATMDDYFTPSGCATIPWAPAGTPNTFPIVASGSSAVVGTITQPVRGWQLNVTAGTGTVTVEAIQAGLNQY